MKLPSTHYSSYSSLRPAPIQEAVFFRGKAYIRLLIISLTYLHFPSVHSIGVELICGQSEGHSTLKPHSWHRLLILRKHRMVSLYAENSALGHLLAMNRSSFFLSTSIVLFSFCYHCIGIAVCVPYQ